MTKLLDVKETHRMAQNKPARIRSRDRFSPLALRIVQTSKGVFIDKEHTDTGKREFVISVSPRSARRFAIWILANIEDDGDE
jgi:hypothetical protein